MKQWNNITIIGVGLIGGSLAKALKKAGLVKNVTGYGTREESLQKSQQLGVVDQYTLSLQEAVQGADVVVLAVPLGAMEAVLKEMQPFLSEETLLTDVGSAKTSVLNAVKAAFGRIPKRFVAGHPIAGKEKSGVEAACENLFVDHRVILTPTEDTDKDALAELTELWQATGACVSEMTPEFHDEVFAATSHLPHLLAFGLVNLLNEHEELGNVFQYTAGGFRDFTRIASSDAVMWRDIALTNRDAIVKWLNHYQAEIQALTELVGSGDGQRLHDYFAQAKQARDEHIVKPNEIKDGSQAKP
ncbi:prephenate dehydrogenase [Thiomicrospira sp. S5]|uniref:prephenate dehydrogenase n=1 Tax=Thiomicrospira sp. S5 TaxID=1803865 RepID=UPI000F89F4A3|nr:prephenate dehydrogenase/arogenate dehydrogenase family protein [Thiomicrospira sp. S5]AZR82110.1 prephenate dehydrogenase [Thiomicrospira sp. S5]